jgi:hypothetical protein
MNVAQTASILDKHDCSYTKTALICALFGNSKRLVLILVPCIFKRSVRNQQNATKL